MNLLDVEELKKLEEKHVAEIRFNNIGGYNATEQKVQFIKGYYRGMIFILKLLGKINGNN